MRRDLLRVLCYAPWMAFTNPHCRQYSVCNMTCRCLYNWLYWSSYSQHDALAENKPLDHHTFRQSVQVGEDDSAQTADYTTNPDG